VASVRRRVSETTRRERRERARRSYMVERYVAARATAQSWCCCSRFLVSEAAAPAILTGKADKRGVAPARTNAQISSMARCRRGWHGDAETKERKGGVRHIGVLRDAAFRSLPLALARSAIHEFRQIRHVKIYSTDLRHDASTAATRQTNPPAQRISHRQRARLFGQRRLRYSIVSGGRDRQVFAVSSRVDQITESQDDARREKDRQGSSSRGSNARGERLLGGPCGSHQKC
jgi:hypothetical protein